MGNPFNLPDSLLEQMLQEDCPCGDATTHALGIGQLNGTLVFAARVDMWVCGIEEAARMGQLRGLVVVEQAYASGQFVTAGTRLLTLRGPASSLHVVWKTAQTLMEYLSGMASVTAQMLNQALQVNASVGLVCTRKNLPGSKQAAMKAILCAGASPHRLSLSETLLVFAEHRAFLGDENPVETVTRLKRQWPERAVVVEVDDLEAAKVWADAGADIIQLEKFSPDAVRSVRMQLPARVKVAAAGGVNLDNAEAYARAGAAILVSSAPYFAKPRDVAVTLLPEHSNV